MGNFCCYISAVCLLFKTWIGVRVRGSWTQLLYANEKSFLGNSRLIFFCWHKRSQVGHYQGKIREANTPRPKLGLLCALSLLSFSRFPSLCHYYFFSSYIFCLKTSRLSIQDIFLPLVIFRVWETYYFDHFRVNQPLGIWAYTCEGLNWPCL